jgi:hypothetical protein
MYNSTAGPGSEFEMTGLHKTAFCQRNAENGAKPTTTYWHNKSEIPHYSRQIFEKVPNVLKAGSERSC